MQRLPPFLGLRATCHSASVCVIDKSVKAALYNSSPGCSINDRSDLQGSTCLYFCGAALFFKSWTCNKSTIQVICPLTPPLPFSLFFRSIPLCAAINFLGLTWQLKSSDGPVLNNGLGTGLPVNSDVATLPSGGRGMNYSTNNPTLRSLTIISAARKNNCHLFLCAAVLHSSSTLMSPTVQRVTCSFITISRAAVVYQSHPQILPPGVVNTHWHAKMYINPPLKIVHKKCAIYS